MNGHRQTGPTGPLRAKKRLMHRSKPWRHSITLAIAQEHGQEQTIEVEAK
jgi:hypothetical protein